MKKIEIDFDGSEDSFFCPVTNEVLYNEEVGYIGLSEASLLFYWEPHFDYASENEWVHKKYKEYLSVLETDEENWDKESMALKLVINDLTKDYKNLTLYTLNFYNSSLSFCIDMDYKPNKE